MSSRRLMILRHAKSSWDAPELDDFDRPLADRGRRAAAAMGVYIRDEGLMPDLVLCSAARRAVETWSIVARVAGIDAPVLEEKELYLAGPGALLTRCRAVDASVTRLALVGHHPGYDGFARELVDEGKSPSDLRRMTKKFPTGALAVIELTAGSWSKLGGGRGALERFVTPKDLV